LFFQKLEGKGKMKDRIIAFPLILILLVSAIVLMAPLKNMSVLSEPDPDTIIVPDDYPTIQEAINHAKEGDTVFVYNGTYHENLFINKMISLIGENKTITIIDGTEIGTVVSVTENNVTISGFTIQNSGSESDDSGIRLYSRDCSIKDNIIVNCNRGISLGNSYGNTFEHNIVRNNKYAIYLILSFYNIFKDDVVENNTCGIYLRDSNYTHIYNNKFVNNGIQTNVSRSQNVWNEDYPSGGNYWSNWTTPDDKSGENQDRPGSDGIVDLPYIIDEYNVDHYPRLLTVHNVNTKLDYFWIQDAIDAYETRDGHTIEVDASIYLENVQVYKSLTLHPTENRKYAIIDGEGGGTVLKISASNVSVSNFTIQNGQYGIYLDKSGNAILRNNNITNNQYNFFVNGTALSHFINDIDYSNRVNGKKIYYLINNQSLRINSSTCPNLGYLGLVNCTNLIVENLDLTENGQGLLLAFTNNSKITHVNPSNNLYGIYLFDSTKNTITANIIAHNDKGISLLASSDSDVNSNNVTSNIYGVQLWYSNNSKVVGNNVTNNSYGIWLNCQNNNVINNSITDNHIGILLGNSSCNNYIIENSIVRSGSFGISLIYSANNYIYHNSFLDNKNHASATPEDFNIWDNGSRYGGNYWGGFTSPDEERGIRWTDYHQKDAGSDGIVDRSYIISLNNRDKYALTKPYYGSHDIGIRNVTLSRNCSSSGYRLEITVKVINYGFYDETGINITIEARNITTVLNLSESISRLPYRDNWTKTFSWDTTGQKNGTYTIQANLTHASGERYFDDNIDQAIYKISIQGDITGDFKVDIKDLVLVIKYFGSYPGSVKPWNPNADVNGDNKVDIKDLVLVIKHFGEHYP
jgi:parallel beta-helix repeat protein